MKKIELTIISIIFCIGSLLYFLYSLYDLFLWLTIGMDGYFNNFFVNLHTSAAYLFYVALIGLLNLIVFVVSFLRGLVKRYSIYKILAHFGLLNLSFVAFFYFIQEFSYLIIHKRGGIITFYGCLGFILVMWYCQMSLQFVTKLFKDKEGQI